MDCFSGWEHAGVCDCSCSHCSGMWGERKGVDPCWCYWHVCVPTEDEAEHSLVDKEVSQVGKQTELVELLSS